MSAVTAPPAAGAEPAAGRPPGRRRRPLVQRVLGRNPLGWLFGAPYLAFVLVISAYPLGYAIYISFFDYFFAAPGANVTQPFIGVGNYVQVFTDSAVLQSFLNVGVFLIINVPLTVLLSLVLASGLNSITRFRTFLRVSYYVPYVTASVAIIGVWLFLFSGGGLVNQILGPLAPDPSWFVNPVLAMPTIAIYVTWKQLGLYILLYLAALQNVPRELYESAATDGGGRVRQFFSVTVPGVRPATVLVLLSTITGANLFTEPYLLTGGGGPDGKSTTPVLLIYQQGIQQGHPGYAAAIGVVLVVLVLVIGWLQNRFAGGRD
ncbi:ABC transporter permease [Leifsonia xyli subsp. cynodontis DSM 46306]|uniref:ABC transmembrane type-1 domain-containing protein n=1 Tax=Leifsonia xyli subsp. cynodontis DSM 46306 TaxID=1389489 RepID=U3P7L6_LEIXC|nr:sugar ABC transporter permease [Leifsonia xyli]AGW41826.1 ABC transporter permease [Leifsonia xyli subsp. cynodontis DSM 46306]